MAQGSSNAARIRIYGIHFDVDKATIKPQSEPGDRRRSRSS